MKMSKNYGVFVFCVSQNHRRFGSSHMYAVLGVVFLLSYSLRSWESNSVGQMTRRLRRKLQTFISIFAFTVRSMLSNLISQETFIDDYYYCFVSLHLTSPCYCFKSHDTVNTSTLIGLWSCIISSRHFHTKFPLSELSEVELSFFCV